MAGRAVYLDGLSLRPGGSGRNRPGRGPALALVEGAGTAEGASGVSVTAGTGVASTTALAVGSATGWAAGLEVSSSTSTVLEP